MHLTFIMNSLEYDLNEKETNLNPNEKYFKCLKIILIILIVIIILLIAGFIVILVFYLKNVNNDDMMIYYNLTYPLDDTIKNSFKLGEINYNQKLENVNNGNNYYRTERNIFDLFIPNSTMLRKDKYNKVILYIHGGGYFYGDKKSHHKDCKEKGKLGFICATMNYNYLRREATSEYTIMRNLDEITAVIETIKRFLKILGYNEKKLELVIGGGSAGGHYSSLYAYWLGDKSPIPIKFVVTTVAPITFEFEHFWTYNKSIGPLDSIEPEDIKIAKDTHKIINNTNNPLIYWNTSWCVVQMNIFLGRGFDAHLFEMFISDDNWDINRTNPYFIELYDTSKLFYPVYHIDHNTIPTLCYYGGKDVDIGIDHYPYLRTKYKENDNNGNLTLVYSKYANHSIFEEKSKEGMEATNYFNSKFTDFMNKYLSKD